MNTKIKKIGVKIIFILALSLSLSSFVNVQLLSAAPLNCSAETGWTPVGSNCENPSKEATCTAVGGVKDINIKDKTVCKAVEVATPDEKALEGTTRLIIAIQGFINRFIWPVLVMIGGLLDNSLLFGNGMEERLRAIWVPIRNLVNILFVIILVGIALYNVLGIGDDSDNYSLKAILPKILIGIIAVNFSFLGIKVFLDAINVLTVSIFSLPSQVSVGLDKVLNSENPKDKEVIKKFCENFNGYAVSSFSASGTTAEEENLKVMEKTAYQEVAKKFGVAVSPTATQEEIIQKASSTLDTADKAKFDDALKKELDSSLKNAICQADNQALTEQGKAFLLKWNSQNSALAMVLNMTNLVFYKDIHLSVGNISTLFINTLFSTMMYIIYLGSFLALFIVLLARLVVMWVAIVMSPVLLLGMAVPLIKEKVSAFGDIQDKFIQNAIAPLSISIAMTIGWIMLQGIQSVNSFDSSSSLNFNSASGFPVVGLNDLQNLIVALGTVGVVWLAVFGAASKSIAAPVTDMIKGGLERVGKFVGTIPIKNLPIMPITLPSGQTIQASIPMLADTLTRIEEGPRKERTKLSDAIFGTGKPEIDEVLKTKDGNRARNLLKTYKNELEKGDPHAMKIVKDLAKTPEALNNFEDREQKLIKKIAEASTDAERQAALKELFELPKMKMAREITGSDSEDTAAAPSGPTEPTISDSTKFTQTGAAAGAPAQEVVLPAGRRNAMKKQATTLIKNITDSKKDDITKQLEGTAFEVEVAGNKAKPTAKQLEAIIGTEEYGKLKTVLGNVDDNKVNELLGHPPAPPTPPAGTP